MDSDAARAAIAAALNPRREDMLALLERLVNIDSPTRHAEGVNAVGRACADWLAEAGFETRRLDHPPIPEEERWQADLGNAWTARTTGADTPGIGFIGHLDTVFPVGTARRRPFARHEAGDRLTGPGVADMKAGLVSMLFAARALRETGLLPCPLTLFFSCDEELGSPTSSKKMREVLTGAKAVFSCEPGGPRPGRVTLSRKGSGHMHLTVQGRAAHAGRNFSDGASAILAMSRKILDFNRLVDLSRGLTVNTGLVSGGTSANTVAPSAEARVHLTYRTLEDGERVVDALRRITAREDVPGTTAHISGGLRLYPLMRTKQGDRLYDIVRAAGAKLGLDIVGQHYESAGDSGFCSTALGVPTICCMGPEGDHIHSEQEYLVASTLLPRTRLLALSAVMAAHADLDAGEGRRLD